MALWATVTARIKPPININILIGSRVFIGSQSVSIWRQNKTKNKNVNFSSKLTLLSIISFS